MKIKLKSLITLLLAFVVHISFAQQQAISGTITDESGLPLPGATVIIRGTSTGSSTDFDGKYSIQASSGQTLVFSYVGYSSKNVTVGSSTVIDVTLQPDNALEEVVITALGIKRKVDEITTANQVVQTEELVRANNPSVLQGLAGKVTGLQVTQTSNGVSGEARIVLRGNRSITGDNQALIVIDGAISSASFLNSIDPNNIESINVIKGANGAALYGQQGANGVMIITTKRGTEGEKMKVTFKSSTDIESVAYVPEQQTRYGQGWDYGNGGYENVVFENGAWGPEFDGQMVPVGIPQADGNYIMAPYSSRGADHLKDFFDTGHTYQNTVSLSSGDADGYMYLSANNQSTQFVIKNDKLKRSTFNFKAGKTLGNWKVSGNATYSNTATQESFSRDFNNSIYRQLLQIQSNVPIREFEHSGNEGSPNAYYSNPYWSRDNQRRDMNYNRFNILGEVEYSVNDNISALIRSNGLFTFSDQLIKETAYVETPFITSLGGNRSVPSFFRERSTTFSQYYTDIMVNFDYNLTDDITFKANVGVNNQYTQDGYVQVAGEQLSVPGLNNSGNLGAGFDNTNTGNNRSNEKSYAVFANIDFGYRDFVFLNATARNDWTSVLSPDQNNFFYPSVGMSFIPTKAFKGLKGDILNYAKLSANYVRVGSKSQVRPYDIQEKFTQAPGFPFGGQNSYVAPSSITDPNIEPEFTTSLDFGLNLGFLNDRITLDAAYYKFNTDNQITRVTASKASGLSTAQINLSETKGWGTEIDLGLVPIRNENVRWNVNFGFTKNYTEVVKISEESDEVALGGLTTIQSYAVAGEQFPIIKGTDYERDDQGRVIIGSSGLPTEATGMVKLGNVTPDYILNARTSITYKAFTFAATMDYRTGHKFYSMAYNGMLFSGQTVESAQNGRGGFIYPNSVINTGTAAAPVYTPNTDVVTGSTRGQFANFYGDRGGVSSASIFDATAFKVRELSLSYDVNPKLLKQTFINSLTLSAVGRNLITVLAADNRGYNDPESNYTNSGNGAGIAYFDQYPPTKSYGFSLNLTF